MQEDDDADPVNDDADGGEEVDLGFPDDLGMDGSGSVAAAELPDDLASDAGDDRLDVDMSNFEDVGVDVSSIKSPRPVTRTIVARSLTWSEYPSQVGFKALPDRPDECGECDDDECTCDCAPDGIPYADVSPRRYRVTDAVERLDTPEDVDDEDGGVGLTSVYGRVVQTFKTKDDFGDVDDLVVRLADETGVVDVDLHPRMDPLEEYEAGDEILVTHVQLTNEDVDSAFSVTGDSALIRVADGERNVEEALKEQTALVHTEDRFDNLENKTAACNWVADAIVREWTVETPRGGDEMYIYIDNTDSEQYGTFAGEGDTHIKEIIDQYLPRTSNNTRNKNEIVNLVRDRTYVKADAFRGGAPDVEARRWSVAVENGVIDLRTGTLHEHDPAWRCTAKLPVRYDPDADSLGDAWDRFLDDVTKEQADRETLLYFIGHALTRHYPVEAIFALIGPGANGKSVWYKAVQALFGDASGAVDIGMMTNPDYEFGAGSVRDRHLVVDDDATDVKANDLSMLKTLSGGAESQIHEKDEKVNGAEYDNYASIGFLSNDPMILGDKSNGAKRRMYPIIMPHRFTHDPSDSHKDARPKDELLADLTSEEELQRLLAVAVQYAQKMKRDGDMEVGRSEDGRWELYENYADSVREFWVDLMTEETGARVPRSVVYEIYVQWAEANGIDPVPPGGRNGFWQLSDQCPAVSYKRDGVYSDGERAVEHVMLTSEALDHAPRWVQDEWRDDVSEDESTLANRLDRVTPIADLNKGYCTTAGTVIARQNIESQYDGEGVIVTIEDSTRAIDVIEWIDDAGEDAALDGVYAGDRVKLERTTLTAHKGEPQLKVKPATEVTVSEAGPLNDVDDRHADSEADAGEDADDGPVNGDGSDEGMSQEDRVETVRNVIGARMHRDDVSGARIERVIDDAESHGIDESQAQHEIDRLKNKGDAYEPSENRIKLTGGD